MSIPENVHIYTISELTKNIRTVLEETFTHLWLEGEISNLSCPASGHIYFSLKDDKSQIKVVIFKHMASKFKFEFEDGMQVVCFGRVSVYERGGSYQLYVEKMEPKGIGALQIAFEKLKKKLFEEGLFEENHKKDIPFLPKRIGVVTSSTGAAIRDILYVLERRFSGVEVIINQVRVQGEESASEIAAAIEEFNQYGAIDVMIVGRGGGSIEDLWPFNEEIVARAIYNSNIPVISAVGHEIDWTISDFVADVRAATPSAAAEIVVPTKESLQNRITVYNDKIKMLILNKIKMLENKLKNLKDSYVLKKPLILVEQYQQVVDNLTEKLISVLMRNIDNCRHKLAVYSGKLNVLSPLAVLSRGYSVCIQAKKGKIIKNIGEVTKSDIIKTILSDGEIISEVREVKNG